MIVEPLSTERAYELLADLPVAHVAVISDGVPYVTPMSFVMIGDCLYFRTGSGKRLDAIHRESTVCVESARFDSSTGSWESVVVTGEASEVSDPAKGRAVVSELFRKYEDALANPLSMGGLQPMPGLPHLIEVRPREVTAMSSGGGFRARTRPGRL